MSDPAFTEEFDIVVDEIAALYVRDRFKGAEKERVERYFLESPERQSKVKFMGEFLRQVAAAPPQESVNAAPAEIVAPADVVPQKPGVFESLSSWWSSQSVSLRAATGVATLVIVVGAAFLLRPGAGEPTFASLELALTNTERSTGAEIPKAKLSGVDELRITLRLPDNAPPANRYRAQLRGERVDRQLSVQQQDSKSLLVVVPANDLRGGSYAIELTAETADDKELPLRGAYLFDVE